MDLLVLATAPGLAGKESCDGRPTGCKTEGATARVMVDITVVGLGSGATPE